MENSDSIDFRQYMDYFLFSMRWGKLKEQVVQKLSLELFKTWLDTPLSNMI